MWEYQAYWAEVLIRSVAFLSAFFRFQRCLMTVTCDKQRKEWMIENTTAFLLSSVSLQIQR